ncbi:MAG: cellulase family glycosylhydrolase, partial [Armatimonadetes bacterium]|nr:cellulase family glycosylhydrolase [Armatimonadota bacterium]
MRLWTEGRFRGANVTLDASLPDLYDLSSWGANAARVLLSEDVVETESPFGLKESGLQRLDLFLDNARKAGLRVILGFKLAPGRSSLSDRRIWENPEFQAAFADAWKSLAERYRSTPIIAGYNLLSEPNPEILLPDPAQRKSLEGTTGDWNLLAKRLTQAIRTVDSERPLIVESSSWAYAQGLKHLVPTGDTRTVYSIHMFSPRPYTHQDPEAPLRYPGLIPAYIEPAGRWDAKAIRANLQPVLEFQRKHDVPILVGEFGVQRYAPGAEAYLKDLLTFFEEAKWHWIFWSFRESPSWNPEYGPNSQQNARLSPQQAPLMRLYREFLALNDHTTYLQDLPMLKDLTWVTPMRAVRKRFTGQPGTVGIYGDSITFGSQFFAPLFTDGYTADPRTLADLDRFRERVPAFVAEWKGEAHGNVSGWRITRALPLLPQFLRQDNPEVALIMFGTNDMNHGTAEEVGFEMNLENFVQQVMSNGTVPILSTLPPKKGMDRQVAAFNTIIKRVANNYHLPLMDYNGAMIRRRPASWYRTLIIGDGV